MGIDERLTELHREHFSKIVSLLYRKCGDMEISRDITQDTFKTALEKKALLKNHPNLAGWLYITAYNKLKNEMKKKRLHSEVPLEEVEALCCEYNFNELEYSLPRELSADERDIIILRLEKQCGYREIAEMRGISEEAARQQFSRAFRKCKKTFENLSQNRDAEENQ